MILADKIIELRKKNGWSQEELAEKLHVSRQAVSKWEGAQSVPDLEKILQMSRVFGVTTDYLVKDELGEPDYTDDNDAAGEKVRRVSLAEANDFLAAKAAAAVPTAWAVFLCIISPVCLILLAGMAEAGYGGLSEDTAAIAGLCVLFALIAAAVAVFIACGARLKPYEYLGAEVFETEYGVTGMVRERRAQFRRKYVRYQITGTVLCILSVIPLLLFTLLFPGVLLPVTGVAVLLMLVGFGVVFFVLGNMREESMQILLQEGEYSVHIKRDSRAGRFAAIYWPAVTAGYLAYSFVTGDWGRSWIVWPVAGVLSGAIHAILRASAPKD